jgi:hypothetical protein
MRQQIGGESQAQQAVTLRKTQLLVHSTFFEKHVLSTCSQQSSHLLFKHDVSFAAL